MVTLFAAISTVVPLGVPNIPNPVVYREEQYERWWYEDTRSEWMAIEDCWSSPQISSAWNTLEPSVRKLLLTTPVVGMVSGDLDWTSDGFCLRIQGLAVDVLAQREQYFEVLKVGKIESAYAMGDTLDRVHHAWMADEAILPTNFRRRRGWDMFWDGARQRTVYTSSKPLSLGPLDTDRKVLLSFKERDHVPRSMAACNTQVRPEFPQIAVTIQAQYEDVSISEMRVVSSILGDGVRSRLSQRLREELGLVYSIGSRFTGDSVEINYTVSPVHLVDSLSAVRDVLTVFSETGPSATEMKTVRSMFLLRQYEILEDPASFVRMAGRFSTPNGWDGYIARTVEVLEADTLTEKPFALPSLQVWMTGPLKHSEVVISGSSHLMGLCSVVGAHTN